MSQAAWVLHNGRLLRSDRARMALGGRDMLAPALVESLLVVNGRPLYLSAHWKRLREGLRAMAWQPPGLKQLSTGLRRLAARTRFRRGSLRLRLWQDGQHLALCRAAAVPGPAATRLITTAVRHFGPEPLWGQLKTNAMLPNLLARSESEGLAEDGLRLSPGGWVAEGVWSNVVLRRGRKVCTPPLSTGILEGVTRSRLLAGLKRRGFQVCEVPLTRYDLYCADEVWLCSSVAGAVKVSEVDGRRIGL